jgi:protein gp37
MNKTKIEYLTHTWNPLAMRCTPVSDGCKNCWHLRTAHRLARNEMVEYKERKAYEGLRGPVLREEELSAPLRLKKPSRIGIQFMGDLFHESVKKDQFDNIVNAIMVEKLKYHKFFFLTKRPEKMLELFKSWATGAWNNRLPENFWLGVSVEDQKTLDERARLLLQIPAAHRWVSIEPMLGKITIPEVSYRRIGPVCSSCTGAGHYHDNFNTPCPDCEGTGRNPTALDWIVLGGETGPGARSMHPDWVRSVRDQCQEAGVPFFFKSWGEWLRAGSCGGGAENYAKMSKKLMATDDENLFERIGHKFTGHLIDGKEWRQLP